MALRASTLPIESHAWYTCCLSVTSAAVWGGGRCTTAVLLEDDKSDALSAPVGDGSGGAGFIVIRQTVLGQLAYSVLGLAEFLLKLVVPVHVSSEVRCPNLTTTLTTALSVVVEDRGRVEATADYSCEKGRRIVGNSQRKCGSNGIWSGSQPRCEYVTCDLPQGLDNGRIVRLNQTLEYGSLVEYHCLPEHRLVGGAWRSCGELGEWLGGEPKCVLGK
ncbi:locomotion-related protein Hikaru genki-like [Eriocheir sinensis]|uniref:locomotion-related protein Hikaru genki-like n=1 Tax=Eriocheir sinensis TaxID=95602 RepID=UPI0021CAC5EF|nr:locomotion-related protein Hikaru genki-like [Eriocheir sinensis]